MKDLMNKYSIPGTVIAFSINGTNVWTEGFGYTDVENDVITHKDSVWRLASISKPLTSALIGRLMDKKLIDLNHDIHKYLSPDFYPYKTFNGSAVNITVREVMAHLAGLHFTKLEDLYDVFHGVNSSQPIAQFKDEKLLSKPNTTFSYSNYGYHMIGAIIEAVLNSTYDKEIEKMFRQLNMNSTFAEKREAIYKHRPQYYTFTDKLEKAGIYDELVSYEGQWPCGGIIATASDLLRFGNAMISAYNGKQNDFLSQKTVKELWTPETIGKIKPKDWIDLLGPFEYAKGWFVKNIPVSDPYPYRTINWHSGGMTGTATMFLIFPDQNLVGVAFANNGNTEVPGAVIGFSINGTNVWTEGFGYTDVENDVITHKDSIWRLASISKPLTSALIGRLMDKKLIDLNHDIHTYLSPDFYPYKTFNGSAVNITVREVMSHLAGLHFTKFEDVSDVFHGVNASQAIAQFKDEKLLSKPNTTFSYSNYGYQMVGAIIEAVLNSTYDKEIEKMFRQLNMNSTFVEKREAIYKHRPQYYTFATKLEKSGIYDELVSYEGQWPCGGIIATASDILRFGNAMISAYNGNQNDFLSEKTVKELWTPETIGKIKPKVWVEVLGPFEYGKGWFVKNIPVSDPYPYRTVYWHSGGLTGTATMLMIFPDQNLVGVAFANNGNTTGFGYTDVENDVITHKDSIWRLASISKPLTSALIGRLMDKKLIDLNHDIHTYLSPDFYPYKTFNGSAVNITVREVMSHLAGLHFTQLELDWNHVYRGKKQKLLTSWPHMRAGGHQAV
ncbi:unnamed protein product [Medioppia subpectinata]|uniref:Beta-lactamase-related domain-containing protein n=1 Tax=Medioppia subpectinata TaxID=1979941 RepID=A0A7R9Q2Z1_9ACAR|nr:unnamed protein product [Medioppia subpectinata]CAG2109954.1 unnamed protein product [Medioppia subpectinata]